MRPRRGYFLAGAAVGLCVFALLSSALFSAFYMIEKLDARSAGSLAAERSEEEAIADAPVPSESSVKNE